MLKNNLKIAWRQLRKNRLVSTINILGLGLGLTVGIFILLYIQHETNYDQWISEKENIYRVYRPYQGGAKGNLSTPGPVARALREEVPGVVSAARFRGYGDMLIEWKKQHFSIPNTASVDTTFFKTMPLQFQHGDPQTTFNQVDVAVLNHKTAQRIFGNINPVGENILLENSHPIKIVGVLPPSEGPSHLDIGLFIIEKMSDGYWTGGGGYTYVQLTPSVKTNTVESALYEIAKRGVTKEYEEDGDDITGLNFSQWKLQPITDIHLNSNHLGERGLNRGNLWQITLMSLIGLLVLILAAINYINLATAQMSTRSKEVGIRNITGATRQQLVFQFLSEAFVVTFFALFVAIIFSNVFLPFFNDIVSRPIPFRNLWTGWTPFLVLGLAGFTGLITGIFPAFYMSRVEPAESLKKQVFRDKKTGVYRNALIVSQFALSIGLVLFVTLVWQQVNYMMDKDLGFNKDQIAVFRINQEKTINSFPTQKSRLQQIPGVAGVTQTSRHPGSFIPTYTMNIEGASEKESNINLLFGDVDWNSTFQIPLKEGRFFSNKIPTDTASAFIVNETFVKRFNLETPVGHRMKLDDDKNYGTIIGVVEDFHYQGLESKIAPVAICARQNEAWMGAVAVRFEATDISSSLAAVSDVWQNLEPAFPVTYSFLDEEFAKQYTSYQHFGKSITYATVICFFLALIGLFGLTIFIIQKRTKEIGIRKVLGASAASIVSLLSKDFIKLVVIAFMIAAPLAWYFVNGWLENFAYRLDIQWWVFLLVGALAVGIAFLTVGFQSLKAALNNPVDSIGTE